MTNSAPTHKPLNQSQLIILNLLYRFRFATTELIALSLSPNTKVKINRRLKLLVEQGYVGRHYEPSYHLTGRYATFFLLGNGITALKQTRENKYARSVLANINKDKSASERFIDHSLKVFELCCRLSSRYGERIKAFTKSEVARYTYFPRPRPDMYIRLSYGDTESHYLIEFLDSTKPFMVQVRKIKKYIEYVQDGDWEDATGSPMPLVILVCNSLSQQRKLLNYADNELDDFDSDDAVIILATMEEVSGILETKK